MERRQRSCEDAQTTTLTVTVTPPPAPAPVAPTTCAVICPVTTQSVEGTPTCWAPVGAAPATVGGLAISQCPPSQTTAPRPGLGGPAGVSTVYTCTTDASLSPQSSTGSSGDCTASAASGVSSGAAAGIAIATALLGGALMFAVLFWLWRRRRGDEAEAHGHQPPPWAAEKKASPSDTSSNAASTILGGGGGASGVYAAALDVLPQPVAHDAVRRDMASLETSIKNYVDNFYGSGPAAGGGASAVADAELVAVAGETGLMVGWAGLLQQADRRTVAIRAFVATALFNRMSTTTLGEPAGSILPQELVAGYARMGAVGGAHETLSYDRLRVLWRVLTAYMLSPVYQDSAEQILAGRDSRVHNVQRAAREISDVLVPFRRANVVADRSLRVLEEIVADAAVLGLKLFAQADPTGPNWLANQRGLVVFPGLNQTKEGRVIQIMEPHVE